MWKCLRRRRGARGAGHSLMARNMLGRCLEQGWGCGADAVAAAREYRLAAEANEALVTHLNALVKGNEELLTMSSQIVASASKPPTIA